MVEVQNAPTREHEDPASHLDATLPASASKLRSDSMSTQAATVETRLDRIVNGYYYMGPKEGLMAPFLALRELGFLKQSSFTDVQTKLKQFIEDNRGVALDDLSLQSSEAIFIIGFMRTVGQEFEPVPNNPLESGKGLWSIASPLYDRGYFPEILSKAAVCDSLETFVQNHHGLDSADLQAGFVVDAAEFIRQRGALSSEVAPALRETQEDTPRAAQTLLVAKLDPASVYQVESGHSFSSIARGVHTAGYLSSRDIPTLAEDLQQFHGNTSLSVGDTIDIAAFLSAHGIRSHLPAAERKVEPQKQKDGIQFDQKQYKVKAGDTLSEIVEAYVATIPNPAPNRTTSRLLSFSTDEIVDNITRLRRRTIIGSKGGKLPELQINEVLDLEAAFNPVEIERTRALIVNHGNSGENHALFRERPPKVISQAELRKACKAAAKVLHKHGCEVDAEILAGLCTKESLYNVENKSVDIHEFSVDHARGAAQVRDIAAVDVWRKHAWMKEKYGSYSPEKMYDLETNLVTAGLYLRHLYNRFDNTAMALAAYHDGGAGLEGRLAKFKSAEERREFVENHHYVKGILKYSKHLKGKVLSAKSLASLSE